MADEFLTIREVADRLGIPVTPILRALMSGRLKPVMIPVGRLRVTEAAVREALGAETVLVSEGVESVNCKQ